MISLATITINVDPSFRVGPVTVAWHGLAIAVGILVGGWLAARYADEMGLSRDALLNMVLLALAGIVGSRMLYLILDEPSGLLRPTAGSEHAASPSTAR